MTQDSFLWSQSERMPPTALALAVALHVATAAALWWISPLTRDDHAQTPIEVTFEPQPVSGGGSATPASTSPDPQASVVDAAASTAEQAHPPEIDPAATAAMTSTMPTSDPRPLAAERPTPPEPPPEPESSDPQSLKVENSPTPHLAQPPVPDASAAQPRDPEPQVSWPADVSTWRPQVTFERALPEAPPPQASGLQRLPRPPPAKPPVQRAQPAAPTAPRAALPAQASTALSDPTGAAADSLQGHGGARNDYLSRVFRHIEPFRSYPEAARASRQRGRVVTRVTINRMGELVDIRVDRTSGWPLIDRAELAAIQRAMPLPPVPAGMPGDPIVLILPMTYND